MLPARAGHAVAAVSVDGQTAAWANLTTGHKHHVAARASAVEARAAKFPIIAAPLGLLAAAGIASGSHLSAPRAVFALLVAAGPAALALLAMRSAVARAKERDGAVDAALAAATADARAGGSGWAGGPGLPPSADAPGAGRVATRGRAGAV